MKAWSLAPKLILTVFAILGYLGVVQAQITVTEAEIGCLDLKENQGNLTTFVAKRCNGQLYCSYQAPNEQQYKQMGVRAHTRSFCTQAMEIMYHCGTDASKSTTVPGDAWTHPPAELICEAPPNKSGPRNPQLVPVLQGLLQKYQWCILEGEEPGESEKLAEEQVRKNGQQTCLDGNLCTYGTRYVTFSELKEQASRGDPTNFETKLHSAILNDCFKCGSHQRYHTKQAHCTEISGGNNGPLVGPEFESCKAGVDITKLANDIAYDIHNVLQGIGLAGNNEPPSATGGPTIATNHIIVDPSNVQEQCNASDKGYFVAPPDLLDWTPTAPVSSSLATEATAAYKVALTDYNPPAPPTRQQYNPSALSKNNVKDKPNIGANEGRLRSDLRAAAAQRNPMMDLCESAAAFALGNALDGNAFADLSVTGRHAFATFRAQPPQSAKILACLQNNPRTRSIPAATLQRAVDAALDRAYRVANVLRAGGWASPYPNVCPERNSLEYIAVSGEDDQPHRPVDVPSAEFPQYDLEVLVPRPNAPPLPVHTRYMIAHTFPPSGAQLSSCGSIGRTLPVDRAPVLAPDAIVFLYIHGMDSRLEEALDLTRALHTLGRQRNRNYTVISMDLPTSGYADNIDYNLIAPLSVDGHATIGMGAGVGFHPNKYVVPIVDFIENFIVSFVNTLDRSTHLTQHEIVPIGGSLGGNMSFRLGRPRQDAQWIKTVIPWSPAAIWPSLADDPTQHAGLAVSWYLAGGDPVYAQEAPWARRYFFYGGFDWQSKLLGVIPLGGGQPQADYWYRDGWPCKPAYMLLSRIDRYETYDQNFRRWHWRLGMEQLMFSQQILRTDVNPPQPLYLSNTTRMLLLCGMNDTGGNLCQDTRDVAPNMEMTPGRAIFLQTTGHSIHNERPNFLAEQIVAFVDPPTRANAPAARSLTTKIPQTGKDANGPTVSVGP